MYFINVKLNGGTHGNDFLELKIFAIRILNLTYNSSGCESNWSTFEKVRPNDFGYYPPIENSLLKFVQL